MIGGLKLLIVDDEPDIVEMLTYNFEHEGMLTYKAFGGREAIEQATAYQPDIVLLDVMLPDMDGIEVCERLRKVDALKNTLIIFLSARGEDYSQLAGYRAGADDYVVKPVRIRILKHKMEALVGRLNTIQQPPIDHDLSIQIDRSRYLVIQDGKETVIPKKEFELLELLLSAPQRVFRRDEILKKVWRDAIIGDRTIDVHVRKLRERFGDSIIQTVKGVGYKLSG